MSILTADSVSHLSVNAINSLSTTSSHQNHNNIQHHQEVKPPISLSYRDIMTAMTMRTSPTSTAPSAENLDQNTLLNYVYFFIKNFIGATGTNTVAIDNKIEQAMDLVKSHLMFAVREEVEVLKEKISELMERITQLEHENTILRANASPETLALLTSAPASKPTTNSNCANSNS